MKKIIIGLLASDNEENALFGDVIKVAKNTCYNTKNIPENISVYFLYGHRKGVDINKNEYKVTGNNFYCDHAECKGNFIMKTLEFYEWCLENVNFDYIYRGGANCYLDLNLFNKSFEGNVLSLRNNAICETKYDIPSKRAWYGHGWFKWCEKYYPSGIGLLSRDLVKLVVKNKHRVMSTFFHNSKIDDIAMGIFLSNEQGLKPKPLQPMLFARYNSNYKYNLSINSYQKDQHSYQCPPQDYIKSCAYFWFENTNDPRAFNAVHETRSKL